MIPSGARVWIAMGHTDMRQGDAGAGADGAAAPRSVIPIGGDLFVFRGRSRIADQDHLARRDRHVALRQAAREGPLRLALGQGRRGVADRMPSSPACSTGSTGATRSTAGGRRAPDSAISFAELAFSGCDRALGLIHFGHGSRRFAPSGRCRSAQGAGRLSIRRADEAGRPTSSRPNCAKARASATEALIAHFKLQIAKLKREQYGPSAERSRRLLDQLELQLEELEASASEDDLAAETAAAKTTNVAAFERKRPARKPFPEHLPRERVVIPAPCACPACGGTRLSKLGEDVTETLEVIPRQWKVIQTVREKFSCRDCEKITPAAGAVPCRAAGLGRARASSPCCCSRSTASTSH